MIFAHEIQNIYRLEFGNILSNFSGFWDGKYYRRDSFTWYKNPENFFGNERCE